MSISIGDRVRVKAGPWKGRIGAVSALRAPFGDDGSAREPDTAMVGFLIGEHEHVFELLIGNLSPVKTKATNANL